MDKPFLGVLATDPKKSNRNIVVNYSAVNAVLDLSSEKAIKETDSSWSKVIALVTTRKQDLIALKQVLES